MATFGFLQAEVQAWLRDTPADTVGRIPQILNDGLREIQRRYNWMCQRATASVTTVVADGNALTTVADWKGARGKPWYTEFRGATVGMDWLTGGDQVVRGFEGDSTGAPSYLYQASVSDNGTMTIRQYPKPDGASDYGDGEYRISIPYWRRLPALSAADDSNWFTDQVPLWFRWYGLAYGSDMNIDDPRAQKYLALAEAEFTRARQADKIAQIASADTLAYRTDAGGPQRLPWWV